MSKVDSSIYEYAAGTITLKAEGYFLLQLKENSISTIETIDESHAIMNRLLPEGPVYILVNVGLGSDSEEGIYDHVAQSPFGARVKAEALIVHELAARLMGNLFFRYVKKKRHVKIFSNQQDAAAWLMDCMKNAEKNGSGARKMTLV